MFTADAMAATRLRLPRRLVPVTSACLLSLIASGLVTLLLTIVNTGAAPGVIGRWLHSYVLAWSFAFPLVYLLGPRVRGFVERAAA